MYIYIYIGIYIYIYTYANISIHIYSVHANILPPNHVSLESRQDIYVKGTLGKVSTPAKRVLSPMGTYSFSCQQF